MVAETAALERYSRRRPNRGRGHETDTGMIRERGRDEKRDRGNVPPLHLIRAFLVDQLPVSKDQKQAQPVLIALNGKEWEHRRTEVGWRRERETRREGRQGPHRRRTSVDDKESREETIWSERGVRLEVEGIGRTTTKRMEKESAQSELEEADVGHGERTRKKVDPEPQSERNKAIYTQQIV